MALNRKIVEKVKKKAGDDAFLRTQLPSLLSKVEDGHQPKREIEKIINLIK